MAVRAGRLADIVEPGDFVFGTGVSSLAPGLSLPDGVSSSGTPEVPSPATVARLGAEMLARGEVTRPHEASPFYLRRSEAEIKRETTPSG
jgi:tRNA A37 threonylcarbamoyladenosine modification protein TsaB